MLHEPAYVFDMRHHGAYAVVRAVGDLDIAAVPRLREWVRRGERRSPRVVVDLRAVAFMDTFVLRALIELQRDADASDQWSLHLVPGANIQRLLDLAGGRDELRWIAPEQLAR